MSEREEASSWGMATDNYQTAKAAGVDVFSKLPYEVLVIVWKYCRPQELLSLCRTTKQLREYLTQRSTEDIWKAVRKSQAITITETMEVHFQLQGDTQRNYPWPRTYAIPDPPFHLNEIAWADYVYGKDCPYCPSRHGLQHPGTYHRACSNCDDYHSRDIQQIKRDYEADKTVEIRLYSILPYSAHYGRKNRRFWRPICDASRRQMATYQRDVKYDERAITTYVEARRILVKKLSEEIGTDVGFDRQLSVWGQVREIVHQKRLEDRVNRNTAMFLHIMRDTHYEPADLIDFCKHGSLHVGWDQQTPYPSWLTRDAIIFDHAAAKQAVADSSERLAGIREFRLAHETYIAQEPIRSRILKLLNRALQHSAADDFQWGSSLDNAGIAMLCADHLPDILQLPSVKAIASEMDSGKQQKQIQQLWEQAWSSIRWEMGHLYSEWREHISKLVRGPLKSNCSSAIDLEERVFACSECESNYLSYPALLSHSCFSMMVNSPNLSQELAEPVWKSGNGRLKPVDLGHLVYCEGKTLKLRIVLAAIREVGAVVPTLADLSDIVGSFSCLDCSNGEAIYSSTMAWKRAAEHVLQTFTHEEYREDGEWVDTPRLHLRLRYNPNVPVAAPDFD